MSDAIHDPTHPASHNLWSTDIKAAIKYVELVCQAFMAENISEWIAILWDHCHQTAQCTNNDVRILNKIDRDITTTLLHAEQDCKCAKGHAWSPLLANAGCTVIAAKWHLSNVIHGRFPTQLWDRAVAIIHTKAQIKEAPESTTTCPTNCS
jgi:hypothetical protein